MRPRTFFDLREHETSQGSFTGAASAMQNPASALNYESALYCSAASHEWRSPQAMFRKQKPPQQQVTTGRFEIERNGQTAFLEYRLAGKVIQLVHTEVPPQFRGQGVGAELAKSSLDWARDNGVKVDAICPFVTAYIEKHPQYRDLLLA
jgi:predicted GNAT family acetyltransferase